MDLRQPQRMEPRFPSIDSDHFSQFFTDNRIADVRDQFDQLVYLINVHIYILCPLVFLRPELLAKIPNPRDTPYFEP